MTPRPLGQSGISIPPLMLGSNVFGWTADEASSFAVLDAFAAEGFTAIDTADVYSRWVPGNDSESERIIGRWMKARGNRDQMVIATNKKPPPPQVTGVLTHAAQSSVCGAGT